MTNKQNQQVLQSEDEDHVSVSIRPFLIRAGSRWLQVNKMVQMSLSSILSVWTQNSRPGEGWKLKALPSGSAPSKPRRSGTTPAVLLTPHQSTC